MRADRAGIRDTLAPGERGAPGSVVLFLLLGLSSCAACDGRCNVTGVQVADGSTQVAAYGSEPATTVSDLRHTLEQEIALEDPYCGEIAVRMITKPFVHPDEVLETSSWDL